MIICFNCRQETKHAIDKLIESGHYSDISEVIQCAVDNLLVLQEEIADTGAIVISNDQPIATELNKEDNPQAIESKRKSRVLTPDQSEKTSKTAALEIPDIFSLNGLEDRTSAYGPMPSDVWTFGQEIPIDRWIFGQYNRLLPVKASCRALAHLLMDSPGGVPLEKSAIDIAGDAAKLGDFLAKHDDDNELIRDARISTAFPTTDRREKGEMRYANQFVASVNKQGQVSGLLIDLKFISHTSEKHPNIQLTEQGWKFAMMRNPVLEQEQSEPTQKLFDQEIQYLITHITHYVPVEAFAYRAIIKAIGEGSTTPKQLDKALKPYASGNDVTDAFLSTQRSGAISRMTDLGLIKRVREGVRVEYYATEKGREILS